ncbi:DUF6624 domain-containing protein [Deinococcus humi]|uniref:Uncharacterized protein n=1 Tax=Deinococcus humi TaxID=662880 RepID=A0A7W8JXY1_9DEIO|nr:DUF6624 domain-containing protein [Deinococcus humi]MBB5363699.1 hypothetical protein [Deinococcus humi]GGO29713.1 hypothetical protein GCM10008949_23600 [Deinococcus humi]
MTSRHSGQKWVMVGILAALGTASAQGNSLPDETACAKIVAPNAAPTSPAFTQAVHATVSAYTQHVQALIARLGHRPPTDADLEALNAVSREIDTYLARLLAVTGWPEDPGLRTEIGAWPLISDPEVLWCAGPVALVRATTPAQRAQAARMIDQALVSVGEKQRYGTMVTRRGSRLVPLPIEDEATVDARRTAAGLPSLKDQLTQLNASQPPRPVPEGLKQPVVLREVCRKFTSARALNTPLTPGQIDALDEQAAVLVEQDQASRMGQSGARSVADVDRESTVWLKEVLRQRGWPSKNRSTPELAFNAWLLTQHADLKPSLQACILDLIGQQLSSQGEAQNLAYLTDRVRLAAGQPQLYGTQVMTDDVQGTAFPRMLEDPAHVNERRARIGLEPIEEYLKGFERPRP